MYFCNLFKFVNEYSDNVNKCSGNLGIVLTQPVYIVGKKCIPGL